jgi:FHS family L-fucose permease-like MFS transporter
MGPEANSTRRLNLAQAFNPVGTNIGVLLATVLVLPELNPPIDRAWVTPEQCAPSRPRS